MKLRELTEEIYLPALVEQREKIAKAIDALEVCQRMKLLERCDTAALNDLTGLAALEGRDGKA